ncbi:tetratricopeptide repeat protein [Saccharopolyspora gloriosae]|uniref:ATP-binding protein n=1 Tax=Saccharopolyspora gloriosae TaxID=455344 RepID=UPI001FB5B559|nr:tetratricopeptide repeat protein [Saccharopolyspora gloriosae]
MPTRDGDDSRNELSGSANEVIQAGRVSGGIHFHGTQRTDDGLPRQLPADVPGFVNRHGELEQLDLLLPDDGGGAMAPCVVVGTAGVGKTSLAVHWAHRMASRFPDGQLYVNLHGYDPGPLVTPDQALDRFLRALGVPGDQISADLESRAALYRSQLAGRRMLIVLDNAATVGQVRPLLPGSGDCLTLITSRSRLSGLVARDGARRVTLGVLPEEESVRLLRSLSDGHRGPDDGTDLDELARLCARLPLALRIAAERAISRPSVPLGDLIEELRDESALWDALTAGDDDDSDAVRSVFAWSYRALSKDASRLFRLLGLHPGRDFGSAAAAALADLPVSRVRRLLDDLVGAHLLEQHRPDRYEFHDLLRAYATDQARTEESADTVRAALERAVRWYAGCADQAVRVLAPAHRRPPIEASTPAFTTPEEAAQWYERERTNLVAATRAAEEANLHELAWLLPALLRGIYAGRNQFDDWFATSTIGLGTARASGDRHAEADMLESLGKAHTQSSRRAEGIRFQTAALDIRRELGDRAGELASTNAVGMAHLRGHELDRALIRFEQTHRLAVEVGDEYWIAVSSNNTANVYLGLERFEEAVVLLRDAKERYTRLGVPGGRGDALRGLSHAHRGLGRPESAHGYVEEALAIAHEHENRAWEAYWSLELGRVQVELGQPSEALISFQRAASLQRRLADRSREAEALDATGTAYLALDRADEAAGFHRMAANSFRELDDRRQLAIALDHLTTALDHTGDAEADECRREAAGLLADFTDPAAERIRTRLRRSG